MDSHHSPASHLASRFREVILNGTWIANTNFKDQLEGTRIELINKSLNGCNTIGQIAQHIHYYIKGVSDVLKGGELLIKDSESFNFRPILDQSQWDSFLKAFWNDANQFSILVEQLSVDRLESYFYNEKYGSYSRNIEAMIEHSYYHLGQIVLIKKILSV